MILVVDDETAVLEFVRLILVEEGYSVRTATDGEAALACLETVRPDLVLCDVMLPGLGGWAVYGTMQAHPGWATIPVVLMSAIPLKCAPARSQPAALLPKPFDTDALLATVARLITPASAPPS